MKFTKKIKDNWLAALHNGLYKQGTCSLYNDTNNTYCCIGVLGDCTPGLENTVMSGERISPYDFLSGTIGKERMLTLTRTNDLSYNPDKPDYTNVLDLIEALPVEEE